MKIELTVLCSVLSDADACETLCMQISSDVFYMREVKLILHVWTRYHHNENSFVYFEF